MAFAYTGHDISLHDRWRGDEIGQFRRQRSKISHTNTIHWRRQVPSRVYVRTWGPGARRCTPLRQAKRGVQQLYAGILARRCDEWGGSQMQAASLHMRTWSGWTLFDVSEAQRSAVLPALRSLVPSDSNQKGRQQGFGASTCGGTVHQVLLLFASTFL